MFFVKISSSSARSARIFHLLNPSLGVKKVTVFSQNEAEISPQASEKVEYTFWEDAKNFVAAVKF